MAIAALLRSSTIDLPDLRLAAATFDFEGGPPGGGGGGGWTSLLKRDGGGGGGGGPGDKCEG